MMGEGMLHEIALSLLLLDGFPRSRVEGILRSVGPRSEGDSQAAFFEVRPPDLAGIRELADPVRNRARRLLRRLSSRGIGITCLADSDYPDLLREIHNPPPVLFYMGSLPKGAAAVAIVGSRKASLGGIRFASRLAGELAGLGVVVVSGLARGIDTASHRGALEAGGKTIAVLGCGIDVIYPPENRELERSIACSGVVLTELLPGVQPLRANFPQRNRIISGLSLGTVVVEAGKRSGALITAACALEQNRSVFAVPGTPGYYGSKGTNSLLKQGARLVESVEDVMEEIAPQVEAKLPAGTADRAVAPDPGAAPARAVAPDPAEECVLKVLSAAPVHVDEICRNLDLDSRDVISVLFSLETRGLVRSMPGKFYVRESAF
jgi:DNA processing protein